MKFLLIFISFIFSFADVSAIILKIKSIENMKKHFLNINYNIFATTSQPTTNIFKVQKTSNLDLKIYAVFNKRVNINGRWYKKGEEINGYKIISITDNEVLLKKGSKIVRLKFANKILKVKQ